METRRRLTDETENVLARAVEAGVLAKSILAGQAAGWLDCAATRAELEEIVAIGDAARVELLEANLPLVWWIVRQEYRSTAGVAHEELAQEGFLAMVECLSHYDWHRGKFGSYAAWWIRSAVRRAMVDTRLGCTERGLARSATIRRVEDHLTQRLGRAATSYEVGDVLAVDASWVERHRRDGYVWIPSDADEMADPRAEEAYEEVLPTIDTERLLRGLDAVERRVVAARFGIGCPRRTITRLAGDLGLSTSQIHRIERRALERLRGSLLAEAA